MINIVCDQASFDAMHSSFKQNIEMEGYFNLYRNGELKIADQEVELKIKGSYSTRFTLKSLGIKFENIIDNSSRNLINPIKVLPQHSVDHIKAIRLRNSGNDFEYTMIKDISYTQLAIDAGLDIDVMYSEQAVVFVNDVYHGLMNIRTEGNTNGMAQLNNVSKKAITLAKSYNSGNIDYKDGDIARLKTFFDAIETKDVAYLKANIDLDNFIDYMVFESSIANVDWPYNNLRMYAVNGGKFRFILYDLDWVNSRFLNRSMIKFITEPTRNNLNEPIKNYFTDLFKVMYKNESFKKQFDKRAKELITSGLLSNHRFESIVYQYANNIGDVMPTQIDAHKPNTLMEWNLNVQHLVSNFKKRESYLKKEFN